MQGPGPSARCLRRGASRGHLARNKWGLGGLEGGLTFVPEAFMSLTSPRRSCSEILQAYRELHALPRVRQIPQHSLHGCFWLKVARKQSHLRTYGVPFHTATRMWQKISKDHVSTCPKSSVSCAKKLQSESPIHLTASNQIQSH